MKNQTISCAAALAAMGVLSACGGGGAGGGSTSAAGALNYVPVYRTLPPGDLFEATEATDRSLRNVGSSDGHGATGVMALQTFLDPTPELRSFKIRLNSTRTEAYLKIDGFPEITMPVDGSASAFSGFWGDFFNGHHISLMHFGDMGQINYSDNTTITRPVNGWGYYGLETPSSQLPPSATYSGTVDALSYESSSASDVIGIDGTFTMLVNFGGSVSGTTGGTLSVQSTSGSVNTGTFANSGTISGTSIENGLTGTMTFSGGGHTASATFAGKAYGWEAGEIGGALIGTFDISGGGTRPIYGAFEGTD